jgi:ATP/ADP translocase
LWLALLPLQLQNKPFRVLLTFVAVPILPLQLSNVLNTEQLFYTCIFPFIAFFGAFAFVLYPMQEMLHPTGEPACDRLFKLSM